MRLEILSSACFANATQRAAVIKEIASGLTADQNGKHLESLRGGEQNTHSDKPLAIRIIRKEKWLGQLCDCM
jgi:hypothetical protein